MNEPIEGMKKLLRIVEWIISWGIKIGELTRWPCIYLLAESMICTIASLSVSLPLGQNGGGDELR